MIQAMNIQLEELVKLRREKPQELIAEAVQIGLSKLYADSVLKQYLNKRMSRNKAVGLVGIEAVKLAEQQYKIIRKDVSWGLKNG